MEFLARVWSARRQGLSRVTARWGVRRERQGGHEGRGQKRFAQGVCQWMVQMQAPRCGYLRQHVEEVCEWNGGKRSLRSTISRNDRCHGGRPWLSVPPPRGGARRHRFNPLHGSQGCGAIPRPNAISSVHRARRLAWPRAKAWGRLMMMRPSSIKAVRSRSAVGRANDDELSRQ